MNGKEYPVATMQGTGGVGRVVFREDKPFNGVKIFSTTMVADRERLGEKVTAWIQSHPQFEICEVVITQSSDEAFHCIAITVFYWEDLR